MDLEIKDYIVSTDDKLLYDFCGFSATCPQDIKDALEAKPVDETLDLKINSYGGDVEAGKEIYAIIRARKDVTVEVRSVAASAASLIAMGAPSSISPAGIVMIHNVSEMASGNKNDLRKEADTLAKYDESLAAAYSEKTGLAKDEILKMMNKTTWLTADEAVEKGFIDKISEPSGQKAAAINGNPITAEMRAKYEKHLEDEETKKQLLDDLDKYGN